MARCARTWGLEVHHKRRDGGNNLNNAEVLCGPCHEATSTYGQPGPSPPPFSDLIRNLALECANNQCQCERIGSCHGQQKIGGIG